MAQLFTHSNSTTIHPNWVQALWHQPIERLFWVYGVPLTDWRGGHRHQSCQMVLHCPVGSLRVYIQTPERDQWFTLDSTDQYLWVKPDDWRLMYHFSPDALLTVLASKRFTDTVYIEQSYRQVAVDLTAKINAIV